MLKKHTGPTIWFHSIKLKLFKIQLSGSSLALFWFRKTVISEKSKNKSLNLLIKINLKSFNLIEWNQILAGSNVFFGTFVTFGRRSALTYCNQIWVSFIYFIIQKISPYYALQEHSSNRDRKSLQCGIPGKFFLMAPLSKSIPDYLESNSRLIPKFCTNLNPKNVNNNISIFITIS